MSAQDTAARYRSEIAALATRDTPHLRALRKVWSQTLKVETGGHVVALAEALEAVSPQEGKWLAYELIRHHAGAFAEVSQLLVERFTERAASWYAVDALGTILTGALWAKGRLPDGLFEGWSRSENRWLRRSALVATVGLNASGPDPARTFPICLRLAEDRDDMVEKAVSWALRYLSQKDRAVVETFMVEHGARFRPRVRREVGHKLATGFKTPRRD